MTNPRPPAAALVVTIVLLAVVLAGCGQDSTNGTSPAKAALVVVSTDWVCAQMGVQQGVDGPVSACRVFNAHGVFRNDGPAGSAAVDFSVNDGSGLLLPICTAAIPQTASGGTSEASCQSPSGRYFNLPTATVK
jgi:hypothetical protein